MAELATGAVNSLLGVIRNEAALLRGVRGDVHFIKEEMESMNSFLLHLARTTPPGEEHDEQVQTWMGQVRLLAHDCNNCLDVYLSRGNPDINLPKKGPLRYLLWAHWYLQKMVAQHQAAGQLKMLKERARDVGERRMRYSVKVPEKVASAGDKEHDGGDDQLVVAMVDHFDNDVGRAFFQPRTLDDYFEEKLVQWRQQVTKRRPIGSIIPSVSIIVAPDEGHQDAGTIAHEALAVVRAAPDKDQDAGGIAHEAKTENHFKHSVLVDIPSLHMEFMDLRPREILYYILRELKELGCTEPQSQAEQQQEGEGNGYYQGDKAHDQQQEREGNGYYQGDKAHDQQYIERRRKWGIYFEKKQVMEGVKRNIRAMKLNEKIEELKKKLEGGKGDRLLLRSLKKEMKDYDKKKLKGKISEKTLGVLLLLLQSAASVADEQDQVIMSQKDMPTLALWYEDIIEETTKKLRELMEKKEGSDDDTDDDDDDSEEDDDDDSSEDDNKPRAAADNKDLIRLDPEQYANILREVFPKSSNRGKRQQDQHKTTSTTPTQQDLSEETQMQQIVKIEKEKLKLLQELLWARTSDDSKSSQAHEEDNLARRQPTTTNPTADGDQDQSLQDSATVQVTIKEEDAESSNSKSLQAQDQDQDIPILGERQLKQIFEKVKVEILRELSPPEINKYPQAQEEDSSHVTIENKEENEGTSDSKSLQTQDQDSSAAGQFTSITITQGEHRSKRNKYNNRSKLDGQEKKLDEIVQETKEKIEKVKDKIKEQLKIRRIMDKIKATLNNKRVVVIVKIDDQMIHRFPWEKTRNALRFLDCIAGVVIVTSPSDSQQKYCYPQEQEPINYSLVGLYHDDVLKRTSQKKHQTIIRDILEKCKPDEFCMKIFAHALYANPKRRIGDLNKLHSTLQKVSQTSLATIAKKKVFKFSYNDLPDKEYKSCLLYLAIFPPEYEIRRSTLIGRWVAEGLITTEDWLWSNSVCKAEKCFDALIRRLFVHPVDFGPTGEVKSCMVTNTIHDFITNIAEKQHIIEARLSHHLAHHFSIYNDLRLRGSDTIIDFFRKLSKSSPLLKVLDLQGCQCFGEKNIWFLKQICSKILLLKYLSLRGTNATQLPIEINNLQELEVLDIRQTKVPAKETRHIRLLKLKRLLAGDTDPSLSSTDIASVQVPEKVENMEHMEVLSNVKPLSSQDLKDIGTLSELRKLGIVIEDKDSHLRQLFIVISNLHKHLRSLSITLHSTTEGEGTPYSRGYSCLLNVTNRRLSRTNNDYHRLLKDPPKLLESLSITGTTQKMQLLQELQDKGVKELVKVTLSNTQLRENDLKVLSMLPKLQCFRLRHISCTKTKLTFNEDEFPMLKYFLFEGSSMTEISFEAGATHGLDEIVLSFNIDAPNTTTAATTTGNLPKLEEHGSNNKNTTTNTIVAAAATGVDALPTQESNNNTTIATTNTTNKVNGHPKLQQESNNNDTAAAAAATEVDSLTKLAEQKLNNSTTTATRVNSLQKQEQELHTSSSRNSMLLSLFDYNNAKNIAKVTLCGTQLKEGDIRNLAKKPKLRCLVLLEKSYDETKLTVNKDEFPKLNILNVNCSNIEKISFTSRSAPKLEKIIWTFTNSWADYSLSGISNLPKLKDFKFNGDAVPHQVQETLKEHGIEPVPEKRKLGNEEQEIEKTEEEDDACFPFCWKNQI